jgi:protein SCO1/2
VRARVFIAILVTVVIAAGITAGIVLAQRGGDRDAESYRGGIPPARIELPEFTLRDYRGTMHRSADLQGKVVLVTFLDTQCRSSCPVIASQIGLALDRLTPDQLDDVVPIAITSDPPEDTPETVGSFLRRHRVEGRLRYLIGTVDELRPVWKAFQVAASFETGIDDLHSAPVRVYDRGGLWVSTLHAGVDLSPDNLAHDIGVALAA